MLNRADAPLVRRAGCPIDLTPRSSGTTLDAQKRYADGTIEIIEQYFAGKPITPQVRCRHRRKAG